MWSGNLANSKNIKMLYSVCVCVCVLSALFWSLMNEDMIGRVEIALLHTVPLITLINTEDSHRTRNEGGIKQQVERDSVHGHQQSCVETQ